MSYGNDTRLRMSIHLRLQKTVYQYLIRTISLVHKCSLHLLGHHCLSNHSLNMHIMQTLSNNEDNDLDNDEEVQKPTGLKGLLHRFFNK